MIQSAVVTIGDSLSTMDRSWLATTDNWQFSREPPSCVSYCACAWPTSWLQYGYRSKPGTPGCSHPPVMT